MTLRSLAGLLIALAGAWLLWGGINAVNALTMRGSPLDAALLEPPTSLIRIIAAALVLFGGLSAMAKKPGGAWLAGIGTGLFTLLAALMALSGADIGMWRDEAVWSAALIIGAAALVFVRRKA
jgi:hypothetical protein